MKKFVKLTKDRYYYTQDSFENNPFWMICQILDSKIIQEAGSLKLMATANFITKKNRLEKKESACLKSYSRDYRDATAIEIYWLKECIQQNKFIAKEEILENLLKGLSIEELTRLKK